jgi:hypothetical protein
MPAQISHSRSTLDTQRRRRRLETVIVHSAQQP